MRSRGRSGRGCCSSRLELAALVVLQAAEPGDLEPVLLEQSRGTRSSSPALSSGEDRPVLRKLAETALELAHRDVDVAFAAAPSSSSFHGTVAPPVVPERKRVTRATPSGTGIRADGTASVRV